MKIYKKLFSGIPFNFTLFVITPKLQRIWSWNFGFAIRKIWSFIWHQTKNNTSGWAPGNENVISIRAFNDLLHQTLISNNGPLSFHSCTFYDNTMKSSGFRENPIFLIIPCFWKKLNHLSNSNFASSISIIISKKITLALKLILLLFSSYRSFCQIEGTLYKHFE